MNSSDSIELGIMAVHSSELKEAMETNEPVPNDLDSSLSSDLLTMVDVA